jgi:hypothetical protein
LPLGGNLGGNTATDSAPMLDRPGGHWACKRIVPSVTGLRFWER